MPIIYGGPGATPSLGSLVTNVLTLEAGQTWTVPSGRWALQVGKYTSFQEYDPVAGFYRTSGAGPLISDVKTVFSDGTNYRLANQTGCAIGALITNAGSGYTSAPVVTASSGSSVWRAIVGGAVNTSVTVTNGGTNYTYPPVVLFSAPPAGGIQATGYCTLSSGAVSSVTVTDQGAGYTSAPTITFVNDPRETNPPTGSTATVGYNAAATCILTGSGTITGLLCLDHGTPVTVNASTSVPTLTFTGGGGSSAAATWLGCLTITAYAVSTTTAGSGYVAPILISAYGGFPATSAAYTNVSTQSQLLKGRNALILGVLSAGAVSATGQTVYDGGIYAGAPTVYVQSAGVFGASPVQVTFLTPTMGGVTDISIVQPT